MKNTELIPNVSVGNLKLGSNINMYLNYEHAFFKKNDDDIYMENYYEFLNPPLIVFVNSGNFITTINCKSTCFWKNKNIIGLSFAEFVMLVGKKEDSKEQVFILVNSGKGQTQTVFTFEDLGLQIWTLGGEIVTVSCTNYDL